MKEIKITLTFLLSLGAAVAAAPLHAQSDSSDNGSSGAERKVSSERGTTKEAPNSSVGGSAEPECN